MVPERGRGRGRGGRRCRCRWGPGQLLPSGSPRGTGRCCSLGAFLQVGVQSCRPLCLSASHSGLAPQLSSYERALGMTEKQSRTALLGPRKAFPLGIRRGRRRLFREDREASCVQSRRGTCAESCLLGPTAPFRCPYQEFSGNVHSHQGSPVVCAEPFLNPLLVNHAYG